VPVHAVGANADVALELVLLVDVSGSVDGNEYALQKTGYVNAFNNASLQALIAGQPGGIAVTYIEWSGAAEQSIEVGWTHITDAASSSAFATAIATATRNFSGLTAPGSAINFATPLFASNLFDGTRQVIDVSGDGEQNDGANTATARNNALAAGVDSLNGLPIITSDFPSLDVWYKNNIQGGAKGFTLPAASFADFEAAVAAKLEKEINPTPEPGSLLLMGAALAGVFGVRRRVKSA
jgi:hypothetical protein